MAPWYVHSSLLCMFRRKANSNCNIGVQKLRFGVKWPGKCGGWNDLTDVKGCPSLISGSCKWHYLYKCSYSKFFYKTFFRKKNRITWRKFGINFLRKLVIQNVKVKHTPLFPLLEQLKNNCRVIRERAWNMLICLLLEHTAEDRLIWNMGMGLLSQRATLFNFFLIMRMYLFITHVSILWEQYPWFWTVHMDHLAQAAWKWSPSFLIWSF
jgi:hypothetical protein